MVYLPQQGLGGFKTLYGVPDTARMFLTQQGLGGFQTVFEFPDTTSINVFYIYSYVYCIVSETTKIRGFQRSNSERFTVTS